MNKNELIASIATAADLSKADASRAVGVAARLLSEEQGAAYKPEIRSDYEAMVKVYQIMEATELLPSTSSRSNFDECF